MQNPVVENLRQTIRSIPDFPKKGILFRDITPILLQPQSFEDAVTALWDPFLDKGVDAIAGIESRGFIFGAGMALEQGLPFILIRKKGKLPAEVYQESYELEYGQDAVEIHRDAVSRGQRILIVDDLLATGGTAAAAVRLVSKAGGEVVGCTFLVELAGLNGRRLLEAQTVTSVLCYEGV
ncbi:MAG: adenine phosphoribosyltransferase [Candidatus Eisenbacteria bacterium]|uniref:Adenine phosphoribosyltransferase n=1 Tax=Eiseniibacteriota bacterium TaxID=2212470 RepID=A0A948RX83_UNCEI|nr:adenine phosphoribosyltransferase [Candidatus Eisenbacteria bacterium]MBU1948398.1 adenine phosphoribosyltransferase [Candidatus Eisenbacteria bacterium]MBU2691289.1 adenine phosphoribosyltransferase [Candidatus Eisenbacteria bacterium]